MEGLYCIIHMKLFLLFPTNIQEKKTHSRINLSTSPFSPSYWGFQLKQSFPIAFDTFPASYILSFTEQKDTFLTS